MDVAWLHIMWLRIFFVEMAGRDPNLPQSQVRGVSCQWLNGKYNRQKVDACASAFFVISPYRGGLLFVPYLPRDIGLIPRDKPLGYVILPL